MLIIIFILVLKLEYSRVLATLVGCFYYFFVLEMLTLWRTNSCLRKSKYLLIDGQCDYIHQQRDEPQPEIQELLGKFLTDKISEETWEERESRVKSGYESAVQLPGIKVAQMGGICEPPWKPQLSVWWSCKGIDLDISRLQAPAPEHLINVARPCPLHRHESTSTLACVSHQCCSSLQDILLSFQLSSSTLPASLAWTIPSNSEFPGQEQYKSSSRIIEQYQRGYPSVPHRLHSFGIEWKTNSAWIDDFHCGSQLELPRDIKDSWHWELISGIYKELRNLNKNH